CKKSCGHREGAPLCAGGKHRLWINGFSLFRIFCVILYRSPICVISTGYHARLGINGSTGICDWDRRDWWNDPEDLRVHRTLLRRRSLEPSSRYDSDTPVGVPRNSCDRASTPSALGFARPLHSL